MHSDYGYFEEKKLGKPYDLRLLRRLYPFARPYRLLFSAIIGLIVLITLLSLAVPYITKIAIDRYIVPGTESSLPSDHKNSESIEKIRIYQVRLDNPQIRETVLKYPSLFTIHEPIATIPYDSLRALDRKDLARIRSGDATGVMLCAAALLLLVLASFLLNFLETLLMEYCGQRIMHDLRMRLFTHILGLSVSFFNRNPVGRLVTRVTNDVQNMQELFTSVIAFVFKDVFLLIGIAAVLLAIQPKLALISFSVVPFVILASFKFSGLARDAFRTLRIKIAEINTRFAETVGGIAVIQLFRREAANSDDFATLNHENYLAGMRQIEVFAVFMPVIELLGAIAIAVVIYYGGGGVISDTVSLGALVAFISYMRMFFRPIRDIAEKYNVLQNAMASAERIFLILDSRDRLPLLHADNAGVEETPAPFEGIREIEMNDVSFAYVENEPILKGISLRVAAGESVAVVGPTGSGKTTLIHLITRFYDPTSGRVRMNGRDIRRIDPAVLRSRMALVTQDPFLFSATIRENVAMGRSDLTEERLVRILADSNCAGLIENLPGGMKTILSEGGASVSSGERQLLSIARAIARDPDLIILDEATSYIDSETELRVQEALETLMAGRTSIVIAHRLSTARSARRILVLHKGQILETGTHESLMAERGFYFRLNQLQNTNG